MNEAGPNTTELLRYADSLRWDIGGRFQDGLAEAIYTDAARIAERAVAIEGQKKRFDLDRTVDRLVTSRVWGFPIMLLMLLVVFWLTISGANYPSGLLANLLIDYLHPLLKGFAAQAGLPWWLDGLLLDGMYLATAWVISVMLPPMAIFFPLFTLLEDFGYLPRVAFNLDNFFHRAGAHGKQALSMAMGFGCNAAGVIATRVIDSPRERLIAIITNNFALCNGRWPTQILIATIFIGALAPSYLAGLVSAMAVVAIAVLGVFLSFAVSWGLSRSVLRGEVSTFHLELPPYRPPRILRTIYTSLIDRTIFVLWRAVVFALPAGAAIWLVSNIQIGNKSLAMAIIDALDPFGILLGLCDPPRLHSRYSSQRDRRSNSTDADRPCDRDGWSRLRLGRDVRGRGGRYVGYPEYWWLDPADGREPDALQPDPQSLQHDDLYHLQGNEEHSVDADSFSSAGRYGFHRDISGGADLAARSGFRLGTRGLEVAG